MQRHPNGETARVLQSQSGLNPANFSDAITTILADGWAEKCTIKKGHVEYDALRPKKPQVQQVGQVQQDGLLNVVPPQTEGDGATAPM